MKILANDGISESGIEVLRNAGYEVLTEKISQEYLIEVINSENIEILLVRSATTARKELIDSCPNLRLIGRGGVGMDNIDVEYAREKGKFVINTPGASSKSVAELVMGHMFAISRSLHNSYKHMSEGNFKSLKKEYGKGEELRGKNLTIVGFGRIGQNVAQYAIGCGMNIKVVDLYLDNINLNIELGNGLSLEAKIEVIESIEEGIKDADYITLHIPKQPDGSAVFGTKEFGIMQDNVKIVNAARGGVIDEDALLEALNSGKVSAVALDVFENEPYPRKDILNHPKIACTPHIGAATVEAQDRIGIELAETIIAKFGQQ